jgi:hypothetical protein
MIDRSACAGQKTEVVSMTKSVLSAEEIRSALSIRDLTGAEAGPHAMQVLLRDVVEALRRAWGCAVLVHRESPIVSVEENYDRLHYPPDGAARDLSVAVDGDETPEELGDRVRAALGERAARVESVEVLSETLYGGLPAAAVARLGISPGQKNELVRVVLRDLERALTHEEANELRDEIYAAIHRGTVWHWASGSTRGP